VTRPRLRRSDRPDEQHPHYRARHAGRRAKWPWFVAGLVVIAVAAGTTTVLTRRDTDPAAAA
jgi:hypothetical protein